VFWELWEALLTMIIGLVPRVTGYGTRSTTAAMILDIIIEIYGCWCQISSGGTIIDISGISISIGFKDSVIKVIGTINSGIISICSIRQYSGNFFDISKNSSFESFYEA